MTSKQIIAWLLGIGLLPWLAGDPVVAADRYTSRQTRPYNGPYRGAYLDQIAFPLGGFVLGQPPVR